MGEVNLARVDERLIHGQVMMTLSQKSGVNSIFVVDDVVAKDKFMRELYMNAGSRTGQKTVVTTVERMKHYWNEYQLKDYSCILLTKTIGTMYDLVKSGLPLKELNIGGIAQKNSETDKQVSRSVYMNQQDAQMLKELYQEYQVKDIYFQSTPAAEKTSLKDGLKLFDLSL
ncbi:PTS mannose/fructose/sorbose transporter subunit IIB [Atopobacter sp. AH10]|uniref:PTS system mannose/fructose/N-acetylgalactosamine-transporter subunit IIB n=1 Tax=Atopobacter sp. AH10 TaxID=2315861 RepID=UPI000EF220CE|nr:PTS sugar transporter subunit IIB [Atopobacter sp. AH10]RLK63487.1 PTS mannose/fructose/sorbose transporter subunit IIB [Atopobacter sp. AH10]